VSRCARVSGSRLRHVCPFDIPEKHRRARRRFGARRIGYASIIERNAFVVREVTMPVLSPGSSPLKVLHISDIHMLPKQRAQAGVAA